MSDVIVSTTESVTSVTTSNNVTTIAITDNPVTVSTATAGLQGVPGSNSDPTYVYVRNATGSLLSKGSIVYTSGGNGIHTQVSLALATADSTSARVLGWLAEDIANNADGLCMIEGYLDGVNTQGVAEGTQLYLSGTVAGSYQTTKPQAPIHLVYVGVAVKASAGNGRVFVRVQNGYELDEIHDVQITSVADKNVLQYDSATRLWKNTTGVSITPGTATYAVSAGSATVAGSAITAGTASYSSTSGTSVSAQALTGSITKSQVSDFTSGTVAYATVAGSVVNGGGSSGTATYAITAGTSVYATTSGTSVYATNAGTSVYATTSGTSVSSQALSGTITKSQVSDFTSGTVAYSTTSGTATYATTAGTSVYATTAGTSVYATTSGTSTYATTSGTSVSSQALSGTITKSQVSDFTSGTVAYATTSGTSTYATTSGTSTYSTTSGTSVSSQALSGTITKSQVSDFTSGTVAYSTTSGTATYATTSGTATYATSAGTATNNAPTNYFYTTNGTVLNAFPSSSNAISIFGGTANTTLGFTINADTTYEYEFFGYVQLVSATSAQTPTFSIGSSTVTLSPVVSYVVDIGFGSNTTGLTTTSALSRARTTSTINLTAVANATSRYYVVNARGTIRVTGTGTVKVYPAWAATTSVDNSWAWQPGTTFRLAYVGNSTATTIGTWS